MRSFWMYFFYVCCLHVMLQYVLIHLFAMAIPISFVLPGGWNKLCGQNPRQLQPWWWASCDRDYEFMLEDWWVVVPCCLLIAHLHILVRATSARMSTSIGCNQWLSLAKPALKVTPASRNRSLVARTSMCGWAISYQSQFSLSLSLSMSPLLIVLPK